MFLARALGAVFALGVEPHLPKVLSRAEDAPPNPYRGGVWLAGDHHIHTRYSSDGTYEIAKQVSEAVHHRLGWCVITDHGSANHAKVVVASAYNDLLEARRTNPNVFAFQGLEWNVPGAEHGTVIMPMDEDEARLIAEFESHFDAGNVAGTTEDTALEGIRYLEQLKPPPLFFANHPGRTGAPPIGAVSPRELRVWNDVGAHVMRGFEGAPGHQAMKPRGAFKRKPTLEGYDWMTAMLGGVWDSLLAEGRPFYVTADSDSHHRDPDFFPGEFSKTIAWLSQRSPTAVLEALRSGSMFTVHGDLIDRLEFFALAGSRYARMGGTLLVPSGTRRVRVVLRVRVPEWTNFNNQRPTVHHVDLIAGKILGPSDDKDSMANPTTQVVARFLARDWKTDDDGYLRMEHVVEDVSGPFYLRVRGTSTSHVEPFPDTYETNPWSALWFYSNPIFVRVVG